MPEHGMGDPAVEALAEVLDRADDDLLHEPFQWANYAVAALAHIAAHLHDDTPEGEALRERLGWDEAIAEAEDDGRLIERQAAKMKTLRWALGMRICNIRSQHPRLCAATGHHLIKALPDCWWCGAHWDKWEDIPRHARAIWAVKYRIRRQVVWPRIHRRLYRWLMPAEWPTELLPTEDT